MSAAAKAYLLALDDFGTGYFSLVYLGRLPIKELKIDRSFIGRMLSTRNDAALVNTIIAMGHGLEMELVAEGVETPEQLAYLTEKNCLTIQGFLVSRPLPAEEFRQFLMQWSPASADLLKQGSMQPQGFSSEREFPASN